MTVDDATITLFPIEAVFELLVAGVWESIQPGSLVELQFDKRGYVRYIDSSDESTVIVEDGVVRGWRIKTENMPIPVPLPLAIETTKEAS